MREFRHGCAWCQDTGWVTAVHRVNKNEFAFRCHKCGAPQARQLSLHIPVWSEAFKNDFELYSSYLKREAWKEGRETA